MSKKEKDDKNTFMNLMTDFAFKHMFGSMLPDAKKTWEQCRTQQEKIIYLIKNLHLMDKESAAYKSGEFEDLFNEAELENDPPKSTPTICRFCLPQSHLWLEQT